GNNSLAGGGGIVPVLHIVLFSHPSWTGIAHIVVTQDIFDFLRGVLVHQKPTPCFRLQRTAWVPDGNGAGLSRQYRHIGKHRSGAAHKARSRSQAPLTLFVDLLEVGFHDGRVLVCWDIRHVVELQDGVCAMAEVGERDVKAAGAHSLIIAAAFATGANTNEVYRTVTDVVVAVPLKILGGKLPVTGDIPFLDAAQHLR